MSRKAMFAMAVVLALAVLVCSGTLVAQSDKLKYPLITQAVDEQNLVTLAGSTRPEVTLANDRGPVADDLVLDHMYLQLKRAPELQRAADELIERLHDPKAAEFHHWLTADQVADRFGAAEQDVQTITHWLQLHGLKVNVVYPSNGVIDFSGPAGAVREAFHTEIHNLSVAGKAHIANVSDPRIPEALASVILGIVSMNDFRPRSQVHARSQYTVGSGSSELTLVVPDDLYTIYNFYPLFNAGITGAGQTIAVVNDSDVYSLQDWYTFRSTFGLDKRFPKGTLQQIHPQPSNNPLNGGPCADPGVNGDDDEAILDAEWSSAAAPNATIILAACADTNTNFGGYIAMQNLLAGAGKPPEIFSVSYGYAESQEGAAYNAYINGLYELAVLEGVSVFVSAGDAGTAFSDFDLDFELPNSWATYGINVNSLASTPNNVAVGGTDFAPYYLNDVSAYWASTNGKYYQSALSYVPEITWNDSCGGLLANYFLGFPVNYGLDSLCNSSLVQGGAGEFGWTLTVYGVGSGGPSGCALGSPSIPNVVSGTCEGYPKPLYQHLVPGLTQDGVRDLPDVSLFTGNGFWYAGYVFCDSDVANQGAPCVGPPSNWDAGWGGTSFSSPIMAGIQGLIDQATGGRQGNPNYVLYPLAAIQYNTGGIAPCNAKLGNQIAPNCIFNDVTLGDTQEPCTPLVINGVTAGSFNCYLPGGTFGVTSVSDSTLEPAYQATPGWDFSTGLGSVNAYNLVRAWPGSGLH